MSYQKTIPDAENYGNGKAVLQRRYPLSIEGRITSNAFPKKRWMWEERYVERGYKKDVQEPEGCSEKRRS
jgi:hypothetical protein